MTLRSAIRSEAGPTSRWVAECHPEGVELKLTEHRGRWRAVIMFVGGGWVGDDAWHDTRPEAWQHLELLARRWFREEHRRARDRAERAAASLDLFDEHACR